MENLSPEQLESLWRQKLSGQKRAEVTGQPELELEARLTDALTGIPDRPVPSNFTSRVMNAIDLEEARLARARRWSWNWRSFLPRAAAAAAILLFAGIGLERYEAVQHHRAEMAKSLREVASASVVPDVDALNNFDAIQRMGQSVHADTDLLVALQ